MTERIFVRKLDDDLWQWRALAKGKQWEGEAISGDFETFIESVPSTDTPVCLIVPGEQAIIRQVSLDGVDKKHLAKVMPYEMEEELIDPVEDLHFCFSNVVDEQVTLVYLDAEYLQSLLDDLVTAGCDVQHVLPDYLLLNERGYDAVMVAEGGKAITKFADGSGFAIEIDVLELIVKDMVESTTLEHRALRIVADDENRFSALRACLPEAWQPEQEVEHDDVVGHYWDCIEPSIVSPLNMRSGAFARKLPYEQWWATWQIPVYFAAAAFVFALAVTFGAYLSAKSEGKAIRKQIEQVYLQAVPDGRKGDEERRLKSKLKGSGNKAGQPTNLMVLLSGLSTSMEKQKDIKLSNFRYNGEQQELQVNIEVKGLGELSQFQELLASNGLETGSPRSNRIETGYQANMKIKEKN